MSGAQPETSRSVLVVDDHEDTRSFMAAALEASGYEVRTAADGAEALGLQRRNAAELLITDIFMPGQDGFETITRFKAEFPDATLRKPFTADELLDVVRSVLPR